MTRIQQSLGVLFCLLLAGASLWAQQQQAPATPPSSSDNAEFLQTADAVLADMRRTLL